MDKLPIWTYNKKNEKRTGRNTDPSCVVAGTGFIASRCFAMGQRKKQPKETPIALQSKFLFCSQEDASIT